MNPGLDKHAGPAIKMAKMVELTEEADEESRENSAEDIRIRLDRCAREIR